MQDTPDQPDAEQVLRRAEALLERLNRHPDPEAAPALLAEAAALLSRLHAEALAARRRYQGLFDAVPDPVSIIDPEGRVLDLNRAGLAAYQRPREQIVGQLVHVINPDLPRDHMAPVLDALAGGETYVIEVNNMRADGSRFPVEVHSAAFRDGGDFRIVAVARDLSRRREAEQNYQTLMLAIDKGVLLQDADGRPLRANPAAYRVLGLDEAEDIGRGLRFDDWLVVNERGRVMSFRDMPPMRALDTGTTIESTVLGLYHHRRKQLTWVSVTSVPQFRPGGDRPHQVISLFSDVTELKRDSALFDRVQALAGVGGWEWDAGRNRLHLTDEALRIIGRANDPPRHLEHVIDQVSPGDRGTVQAALESALRDGGGFDLEVRGHRPGGEAIWVRFIGQSEGAAPMSTRIIGTLQDITHLKQTEDALRSQARTDPLTGLYNRDGILEELGRRVAGMHLGTTVIYIDLDRFKIVNDLLGHAAGDQLLTSAARRLERCVGESGRLARFGGDEFMVIADCPRGVEDAEALADRITRAFGDGFRFAGEEFTLTTSVGLARYPEHGDTVHHLINNADAAMYDAKRRGRNTWQCFTPELARQGQERLQVESQLRHALENEEFHLLYQPLVSLADGRVRSAEALLRWNNPALGELPPDRFLRHAETSGDIVRIGAWVIDAACAQLARWRAEGLPVQRMAVNVSYRQFLTEDLVQTVRSALDSHGLPGEALELEVAERVLVEDAPDTLATFEALRALGVVLSIDDFGEGYSALNYLRRLPIHGLKLSRAFLQGVPGDASDVAICQALSGIARSLGLEVVAEGVETPAQRQFLLHQGIGLGQGFLYAPPLEPAAFADYVLGRAAGASCA